MILFIVILSKFIINQAFNAFKMTQMYNFNKHKSGKYG